MSVNLKMALGGMGLAAMALLALPLFRIERQASVLLREALPNYTCAPIYLKSASSRYTWSGAQAYSSGRLQVPQACLADFAAHVRSSPRFAPEACDRVQSCWATAKGSDDITLEIRPEVVIYSYHGKLQW